ncbi:hypothetical protein [Emcibacter sp.]|uniref:hypothetical protein n=1 Tax=Emcibacter sp. TaxID=1979954 RepID=UPI003A9206CE
MIRYSVAAASFVAVVFMGALPVQAEASSLENQIKKCRAIESDSARLACYDALGRASTAVAVPDKAVEPVVPRAEQNFGAEKVEKKATDSKEELSSITATVTKVVWSPRKQFAVYLDNGQIWMQKDNQRVNLPDEDFTVEIKKGALGSYKMTVPGRKSFIRVVRYK